MSADIPYDHWQPLTLQQALDLFTGAPFRWGIAGGYAVEQFLGHSIRPHDDIDVIVFRDEQLQAQRWLQGWELYAADPPGTLREWLPGEVLPYGVHDIWGHRTASRAWELQLMLVEVDGQEWFSRRSPLIRGSREDLIVEYNGVPCNRIDIQLMYKAKEMRPKDEQDFRACLPLMDVATKHALRQSLTLLYPQGHAWLTALDDRC